MAISKIGVQATGFAEANVGLPIPNISLENRAAEAANGTIFFNTSNNAIEVYANGAWTSVGIVPSPTITSISGTIDSGNTGSKISIVGLNFDVDNALLQGTLRFDYNGVSDVTVTPNTSTTINDVSIPSAVLSQAANTSGTLQFIRSDGKVSNLFTENMTDTVFISVDYLVVGGGGGGGSNNGGGGGAGGFRTGTGLPIRAGTNYTVTVGAGGAVDGGTGSNSVLSSITSLGGGGGGTNASATPGLPGGSGGGGSGGESGDPPTPGGSGTPGQGNNGGAGASGNPLAIRAGAGGGGAGASGSNGTISAPNCTAGAGGNGTASSITGTPVTYAGGGGGGGQSDPGTASGGAGGTGGGGQGALVVSASSVTQSSTAGTANLGGGGGAAGRGSNTNPGKAGGSGVVIIKYPDTYTVSNPGGGLTSSTPSAAGGFKVTTFTAGTGNIQLN